MWGYFCIGFINVTLNNQRHRDFTKFRDFPKQLKEKTIN